ncbi:hypothetical protein MXD59_21640 [Frankia sp. Ag45/Mut15]|uniref:Hint domain-containing protein n=1 Tax=Frankia umida TaxID=573489 RepID=A0ABT0K3F0_9ACTN|nr:Hint domain-containing protein [Frankia umida]MCK9878342.1 hypothetical protein [Frankia umida]
MCAPPARCIGDTPAAGARGTAPAARPAAVPANGGQPAAADQPDPAPAIADLASNPCDSSGTGVAALATACRPVTPDQTCWQTGNPFTDRYDDIQARVCQHTTSGAGSQTGAAGIAGGSCTPNSFDGDTEVLLADGSTRPIRKVKVGDRVLSTDPDTGRTEAHTVTALIVGQGKKPLVAVTVDTGHGPATLTATDHHPFWDEATHAWTDADQLTPADTLRTPTQAPTSDVPSNAPSPDASTAASKQRPAPPSSQPALDRHRSVERAAASAFPEGHWSFFAYSGRA